MPSPAGLSTLAAVRLLFCKVCGGYYEDLSSRPRTGRRETVPEIKPSSFCGAGRQVHSPSFISSVC